MKGLQSAIRHSNKKKKEKHNKEISLRIIIEKIDKVMYKFAAVFYALYVIIMVAVFIYSKSDWIVAVLSTLLFVFTTVKAFPKYEEKIGPYAVFFAMLFIFGAAIYFLVLVLKKHVSENANSEISRWLSALTLVGTFLLEHFKSLKKVTEKQNKTIADLEKEIVK